ncbi:hypothetical protein CLV62_1252 [Dysgonomonas alginatilytica]|uniref:Uncharacterized protein n=1 Tax=Dysgonomonas alginatilytica TaxID=1605892 RepID=A0A2V3PJU2_9BACT|nr:hypothetical protein [Dysgonomonas alginatilytica]PXV61169.1 hypothetical protein CLV62_1252 [Dysgonomonas alginatilytica]
MNKYQGEDIGFSIKVWTDNTKSQLLDLDSVAEIIVYIYTDGCKKAMFSKTIKEGYIKLSKVSNTEYSAILDSSITSLLAPGALKIEINIAETEASIPDGKWNLIQRATFGVLKKSLIKIES